MAAEQTKLLNAYLAVGADALKRRTVLERLRARVATMGDLSFNHDMIAGENATGDQVISACNTLPFASDVRLVEVADVDKISKAGQEAIAAYLSDPCPSTIIAFTAEKLTKNSKLYKAIDALGTSAVISCEPMKRFELAKAVRSMAVGHGFTMTAAAAEKLVNLVGEDTIRIDAELSKLALAHRSVDPVNEAEVDQLVARTAEAKPWEFTDAFAARDLKGTLRLLQLLPSETPYALLSRCTARIRELLCARAHEADGAHVIASELGVPDWRVKNHIQWSRRFKDGELESMLVSARDCERAMKSGTDPRSAFMSWLISSLA